MSAITPEAFIRYFQETQGIVFLDQKSGVPVLELMEQAAQNQITMSGYEIWLAEQDESTHLEQRMGAF